MQNPGTGAIFKQNTYKVNQPDFKGKIITPSGEVLILTGWKKDVKNIGEYISLKIENSEK